MDKDETSDTHGWTNRNPGHEGAGVGGGERKKEKGEMGERGEVEKREGGEKGGRKWMGGRKTLPEANFV